MTPPPRTAAVLLCLLGASALPAKGQRPPNETMANRICWQENRRLTWKDFRAKGCYDAYGGRCGYATFVAASTAANVLVVGFVDSTELPDYRVTCYFLRDSSWVNPKLMATPPDVTVGYRDYTLAHEQLHFDIHELIARKIRYYVTLSRARGDDLFGPIAAREIVCLLGELKSLNTLYDEEVNFRPPAVEAAAQRRWTLRVARELDRYKSTVTTCPE